MKSEEKAKKILELIDTYSNLDAITEWHDEIVECLIDIIETE